MTTTQVPSQSQKSKAYELEEEVLKYSGLELNKDLFVYDVTIELQGKPYTIHTYRCGDGNTDDLVMLHGYGGCSALYYRMLKDLSKRFRVFCIGTVGMGLSSKQKFECETTEETLDFLLGSIEKWREAVGLEKFYLAGHSFGGHISGQYARRYQERVKRLFLLSPVGVTKYEEELTLKDVKKKLGFFRGTMVGWFQGIWDKKMTPNKIFKEHPRLGKCAIKGYVKKQFGLKGAEAKVLKDFMLSLFEMPDGAEEAIHYILKRPIATAYVPLEDIITDELEMPVDCFFGQFDYMDTTGAKRITYKETKAKFSYKVVPKSKHQLTMQNPQFLVDEMILSV